MTVATTVDEIAPRPGGAPPGGVPARSWARLWSARRSMPCSAGSSPRPSPASRRPPSARPWSSALAKTYGDRLAVQVLPDDVTDLVNEAAKRLIDLGVLRDRPDLLAPAPSPWSGPPRRPATCLAWPEPTLFTPRSPSTSPPSTSAGSRSG